MKSLQWDKIAWISYGEYFLCCISVKALVNTSMIAGGRKEGITKDLKVLQVRFWVMLSKLLPIISIF